MSLGVCSVSMKSCQNILRQGTWLTSTAKAETCRRLTRLAHSTGPGSSLTIVVGGAAESLSARPGTADLTLKRRMGFIKLAMRQGADLVPVFSFGENDVSPRETCAVDEALTSCMISQIFEQLSNERGTRLYKLQKRFQATFGFTLREWQYAFAVIMASLTPTSHLQLSSSVEDCSIVREICVWHRRDAGIV